MWTAWLRRRFPRSNSRQAMRLPEDTPAGAVPLQAANRSFVGNREMSRTSPITVAATAGPTPKTSVRVVPEARTAAASFFFVSRSWAPVRRRSARYSAASSRRACRRHRTAWPAPGCGPLRQRGPACRPRRGIRPQHGVQPAHDLVAGPAQVPVPPGLRLQHRGVVLGPDLGGGSRAQRGEGRRQGVVGVVLVRRPGGQLPHPRPPA